MTANITPNQVQQNRISSNILGRDVAIEYNDKVIAYALVALRIAMGWVLFQGGITKVLDPNWTAAGFLQHAIPEGNPLVGLWATFAGMPAIDFLVQWGLTLTGFGLIIGALVRWNAFWGAFMMLMFWAAALEGGIAEGLPLEHGYVVDDHLVYAVLLFALGAFGAGRVLGADAIIERLSFVKRLPVLKLILG